MTLDRLARRYATPGRVFDTDDLLQEVSLRALRHRGLTLNVERAMIDAVRAWCGRTGTRRSGAVLVPLDDAPRLAVPPAADEAVCRRELRDSLAVLSPRDRRVIVALYWHGATQADVAQRLGVSRERVAQLRARAMRHLRRRLTDPA